MRTRYQALYIDLKLENGKYVLLQPGFFLLRRFIIAIVIIIDFNMLTFQMTVVLICSILSVAILHNVSPFKDKKWTRIESINEVFILLTLYNFVGFELLTGTIDGAF